MKSAPEAKTSPSLKGILTLVAALGAVIAICSALYDREADSVDQRTRDREYVRVGILVSLFRGELQSVANTLRILADGDGLRTYLSGGQPADLERVERRAVFVSRQDPNYDQVHYLDETGREVVRANYGGVLVPAEKLQDRTNRNYFLKARELAAGQVFVSAFDLNKENGQIEQPLKPTVRFSTPVFDLTGHPRGVYVINFLGGGLIDRLRRASPALQHRFRMLNAQGYWLKADTPDHEWGFMFPDRSDQTLAKTNPGMWRRLEQEAEGQMPLDGGLFTWRHITPQNFAGGDAGSVVSEEPFLIVASQVSAAEMALPREGLRQAFLIVTAGLIALILMCAWFLRARRRVTRALRRSEENLDVTLNSIGDGVVATDVAGKVMRMNRVAEQLTGWSAAEAAGRDLREVFRIIHETTREPATVPVEEVLATGEIHGLANHTVLLARDGSERAIADSAAPIHGRDGTIIGVVLAFRDVSEERAAEAKLNAARNELDRFFTLSLDFLCISSADGYFKRVSPAVTEVLGWTPTEFMAQPYIELVHPDDIPATMREVQEQIATGKSVYSFENRYRHKNGSWRVLSWRSVPQPNGLMYATARDVTARKQTEEQIYQLNFDLKKRAAQLEAANRELEAFSYSVSHDLRAPLRHVQGYVEMLVGEMGDNLSDKARRYLKTISTASLDMGQLIDNLLEFSRMGRAAMTENVIDLDGLIRDGQRDLELATRARNIRWEISPLPKVWGDQPMIKQVIANLLGNAVKYSRGRNPAVIAVGTAGAEDGRIVFFVRDNGAGFDMQYADKLFGVFQRLHRVDEFEGTGIGLANVRRIILRHGGRTWADGQVNVGATFYFTLQPTSSPGSNPPGTTLP